MYSNWSYSPETLNLGQNWHFFCPVWPWIQTDDPEKQQGTCSMLLRALCIISKPSVNSNWSYSLETLNSGQNWQFVSCVTLKFDGWFKLEQLERLRSEIPPTAPWLPILVIHIRSQVKTTQSQSYNFKKLPKLQIVKFCKKLCTGHTIWSCLVRYINMKWIQPEL